MTSTDFRGLINQRFAKNFFPIPATNQFTIGSLAPSFELVDARSQKPVRLSDFVGDRSSVANQVSQLKRPVVLEFTRIFTEKQYCPLCYPHIKELNERYEEFTQRGAEVLMITSTDLRQSKIVARDLGLKMPLLSDSSCRVFRQYQVGQALGAPLPAQFIVDAMGRIRFRHLFSFIEPNASVDRLLVALDRLRPQQGRSPQ
ncbi:MAG TPA: redoxin domain-containing protein [Synechococcales cyanobacterium M55_K2018_004]|nr:redoxin domain-containing protein [Synechococcales cyanobacterium M55_K2018_004]